ncbi:MAG: alanine:cation symporter family protein, partial [Selenomonadaceae bacterium]|nr:alanine:cation symporter family protein [Selenomonadaceae bacterium]
FSNEAGLGSAPIAAAAARTEHASQQGYVNMTGTFFDTMIICFLTGLVIASSGVLGTVDPETGKLISGAPLTILAFSTVYGEGAKYIVSIALALFAYSTILGWEYYGEKSLEYLVKARPVIIGYRIIFSLITFIGATQTLDVVWNFSDTMNGLMAIPNLLCLLILSKDVANECFDYQKNFIAQGK